MVRSGTVRMRSVIRTFGTGFLVCLLLLGALVSCSGSSGSGAGAASIPAASPADSAAPENRPPSILRLLPPISKA